MQTPARSTSWMLVLAFACFSLSSCSPLLYKQGKHKDVLAEGVHRSEIRKHFGTPLESGRRNKLAMEPYDVFEADGPVTDPFAAGVCKEFARASLGLSELGMIPCGLGRLVTGGKKTHIRVHYTPQDTYSCHFVLKPS